MTALSTSISCDLTAEQLLAQLEQVEAQLADVRSGLVQSHRLATLGTLTSIIAHEYNNILTAIISYAQLAMARPDDEALMRKAVEKALVGAERAAKISSSVLGFATESEGRQEANLPQAIDDALGCMARHPSKDGIELTVDVPDVAVAMESVNLQQVLLNLILNARNAMRPGGGRLKITARRDEEMVTIEVADTGPGIHPQVRERLFEPFVTQAADASRLEALSQSSKGTGLGLFICRELVRSAGGTISVASEPGRGAKFEVALPVAAEATAAL